MDNKEKIEKCEKAIVFINDCIKSKYISLSFLCRIVDYWIQDYIKNDKYWQKSKYRYDGFVLWNHNNFSNDKKINTEILIEKRQLLKRVIKLLKQEDANGDT